MQYYSSHDCILQHFAYTCCRLCMNACYNIGHIKVSVALNSNNQNKNPSSREMSEVYYSSLFFVENSTCQIDVVPELFNNYPKFCPSKIPPVSVLAHIDIIHKVDVYLNECKATLYCGPDSIMLSYVVNPLFQCF